MFLFFFFFLFWLGSDRISPLSFIPNSADAVTHYNDVIMNAMASQITSLTIVYLTVYSGGDKKKTSKLRVTGLCGGIHRTGEFPAQRTINAENASIWWRHHVSDDCPGIRESNRTDIGGLLSIIHYKLASWIVYLSVFHLRCQTFKSRLFIAINMQSKTNWALIFNICPKRPLGIC